MVLYVLQTRICIKPICVKLWTEFAFAPCRKIKLHLFEFAFANIFIIQKVVSLYVLAVTSYFIWINIQGLLLTRRGRQGGRSVKPNRMLCASVVWKRICFEIVFAKLRVELPFFSSPMITASDTYIHYFLLRDVNDMCS